MRARKFWVSGQVQGVGYRYFAVRAARDLGLKGWVRNLPDGRVELLAEGSKEELDAFLVAIRESEVGRFIRQEQACWDDAKNEFRGFAISH